MKSERHAAYRAKSAQDGYSLIEIMIAIAFFFIALAALTSMYCKTVKTNALAATYTTLCSRAFEQMEEFQSLPYDDPLLVPSAAPAPNQIIDLGQNRTLSWTVSSEQLIKKTKLITLTLTWQDDIPRTYTLVYNKPMS